MVEAHKPSKVGLAYYLAVRLVEIDTVQCTLDECFEKIRLSRLVDEFERLKPHTKFTRRVPCILPDDSAASKIIRCPVSLQRWTMEVHEFRFYVKKVSGKTSANADVLLGTLSRMMTP